MKYLISASDEDELIQDLLNNPGALKQALKEMAQAITTRAGSAGFFLEKSQGAQEELRQLLVSQLKESGIKESPSGIRFALTCPAFLNPVSGCLQQEKAVKTFVLSLGGSQPGLHLGDGLDYTEEILIPLKKVSSEVTLLEKRDLKGKLPLTRRNTNKGDYGKALILGGSEEYSGAPYLSYAALSALRAGAGYAELAVGENEYGKYALKAPQAILRKVKEENGHLVFDEKNMASLIQGISSLSVGMGMGVREETFRLVSYLLKNFTGRLIIDADGLNSLAAFGLDVLKEARGQVILTPHLGEFSRLSGKSLAEIKDDPLKAGVEFAAAYRVLLILKSASTVITDGKKTVISACGNQGLAKAGSGDLLSGFLAGFSAQKGIEPFLAGEAGAYVLGRSAELAASELPLRSFLYEDILKQAPEALKEIE
jgi:hydroxyethylthiazole kinase-like uncharacterized protein yjeF